MTRLQAARVDLRLVAVVQIYKAEEPHWPVRVYNLLYEDSQEADKFAAAVAREVTLALRRLAKKRYTQNMLGCTVRTALIHVLVCLVGFLMLAIVL